MQSINFPTVPVGEERLRITPTPGHSAEQLEHLIASLDSVFARLSLKRTADWVAAGGRAGVGAPGAVEEVDPLWSDAQLGLEDGSAPAMLEGSAKMTVNIGAADIALARVARLLGKAKVTAQAVDVSFTSPDVLDVHGQRLIDSAQQHKAIEASA